MILDLYFVIVLLLLVEIHDCSCLVILKVPGNYYALVCRVVVVPFLSVSIDLFS